MTGAAGTATAVRLATFAALAAFATFHWFTLLAEPPLGRAVLLVAVTTAGAAALAALGGRLGQGRGRLGSAATLVIAGTVAALTLLAGLAATGVPAEQLPPWRWDDLAADLDPVLGRIDEIGLPYDGAVGSLSLGILLVAPVALAAAAALAFWPARRRAPVLRGLALAALLLLYGTAVSWDGRRAELTLGLVLLVLTAAWLWGPRLAGRRGTRSAVLALAVAALAALPLAARLDPSEPLFAYKDWTLFGDRTPAGFEWSHTYGPLDWPRDGTVLAEVKADRPLYWKAEVLDEFDGLRWDRSYPETEGPALTPFSLLTQESSKSHPEWTEVAGFELTGMRSDFVLGPGTIESVAGPAGVIPASDGTTPTGAEPLRPGDRWAVISYVPDPTRRQLAAAPGYGPEVAPYTSLTVPVEGGGLDPFGDSDEGSRQVVTVTPRGAGAGGTPGAAGLLQAGPYGEVYRLARRITAGAAGPYEATLAVQSFFETGFDYSEDVPSRPYPLAAFLFEDRAGYCQQFSGAMALMLRMSGIPARVVAGFAPGRAGEDGRFEVTDFDAHSWVEVYFTGIGWVTFDPTPGAAPPELQPLAGLEAPRPDGTAPPTGRALPEVAGAAPRLPGEGGGGGGGPGAGAVLLALAAVAVPAAIGAVAVFDRRRRRMRAGLSARDQVAEVAAALARLGWQLKPGLTLLGLERRLAASAGPGASGYVAALRRHLYAPGEKPPPGPRERASFRRGITSARGSRRRLRGWLALPPGGPRKSGRDG